jgi:hypothetical protein
MADDGSIDLGVRTLQDADAPELVDLLSDVGSTVEKIGKRSEMPNPYSFGITPSDSGREARERSLAAAWEYVSNPVNEVLHHLEDVPHRDQSRVAYTGTTPIKVSDGQEVSGPSAGPADPVADIATLAPAEPKLPSGLVSPGPETVPFPEGNFGIYTRCFCTIQHSFISTP